MVDQPDSSAPVSLVDARLQLGDLLLGAQPLTETLHVVARLAASVIPGVDEVCITLIDTTDGTHTTAFSGSLAATLDERQYAKGFGPCLAAAHSGGVVRVDDTTAERSYPDFAAVARRKEVSSALGMSLPILDTAQGAVGLYRINGDGPINGEAEAVATSFTTAAGITLANASRIDSLQRHVAQLNNAILSREVIDLAKGIIMQLRRCDPEEAFRLLTKQSQRTNRKLRDIATEMVAGAAVAHRPTRPY